MIPALLILYKPGKSNVFIKKRVETSISRWRLSTECKLAYGSHSKNVNWNKAKQFKWRLQHITFHIGLFEQYCGGNQSNIHSCTWWETRQSSPIAEEFFKLHIEWRDNPQVWLNWCSKCDWGIFVLEKARIKLNGSWHEKEITTFSKMLFLNWAIVELIVKIGSEVTKRTRWYYIRFIGWHLEWHLPIQLETICELN